MKNLLFAILLIYSGFCNAQKWCPPGAEWTFNFGSFSTYGDEIISFEKETVYQNKPCKKLIVKSISKDPPDPTITTKYLNPIYTYENNDTVFITINYNFQPVYFFNAKVGDTLKFGYINCKDSPNLMQVVDSVGKVLINNDTLRFYRVKFINYGSNTTALGKITIIEKIGILNNDFFPYFYCNGDFPSALLQCYQDDNFAEFKYNTNKPCGSILLNTKEENNLTLSLKPNPTNQILSISNNNEILDDAYIYNISGCLIAHYLNLKPESLFSIDVGGLKSGMYFIKIVANKSTSVTKKFIKE